MFGLTNKGASASKCYLSHGVLPRYVDPKQLPTKKKPFSAILNQPFNHRVDLLLPEDLYNLIWKDIEEKIVNVQYFRVIMSLSDLLEREFLNTYIKTGNILMLSEGRPGIDNLYSLQDGMCTQSSLQGLPKSISIVIAKLVTHHLGNLRLELGKESYERSGLSGKPIRDGGRKHIKARHVIEINLRAPSMLHGKKGFERIAWAFKNVINSAVTWLFYDFSSLSEAVNTQALAHGENPTEPFSNPIAKHHPIAKSSLTKTLRSEKILQPYITTAHVTEDWAIEFHEWISLIVLGSPRVRENDNLDPFLCRYGFLDDGCTVVSGVILLQWSGLIPANWIRALFLELSAQFKKTQNLSPQPWFTLSGHAFHTEMHEGQNGYTILCALDDKMQKKGNSISTETRQQESDETSNQEYILWEFSQASDGRI